MPEFKVPADLVSFRDTCDFEENYKTESVSSRASSPKSLSDVTDISDSSVSESSESPEGSVISDLELEAERIANDLDNMKITEIQAEEMMKEGVDMRHVLQAAWKLKPKITKKFKKGVKLDGSALLKLLNFANYDEKDEEENQTIKMSRAWAQYEKSLNSKTRGRGPPGFENIDAVIEKKRSIREKEQIMVSYANGTNTFNLATEPMTIHDVTVSCMVDTCRGFVQQTKNPTFVGLKNLEEEMVSHYSMETGAQLMRPIAHGSVVAVFTDDKWYRCQVVSYNPATDSCDVKFVDHGGYTTVAASDLRQLKSEFLRLPFQAIEVYFAHIKPADTEIEIDIASEILFNTAISLQLVGQAEDGLSMVQAYYYDGDYVNLFTQEVIDTCLAEVPEHLLTPPSSAVSPMSESPSLSLSPVDTSSEADSTEAASTPELPHCPVPVDYQQQYAAPGYIYTDENGYQHIYYLTGPYVIMPLPVVPEPVNDPSLSPEVIKTDESVVSFGPAVTSEPQSQYEFINKPYEEWTQEDYARYYGDC